MLPINSDSVVKHRFKIEKKSRNVNFAYFFHNKTNHVNNSPKLFVSRVTTSYLFTSSIEPELDKLDVLMNEMHVDEYIPNLSDLELQDLLKFYKWGWYGS